MSDTNQIPDKSIPDYIKEKIQEAANKEEIYPRKYGSGTREGYTTMMLYEINGERSECFEKGAFFGYALAISPEAARYHQSASPELTEPSRQAGAYIVIAFRYGHRDGHSYLVDICGGFDTAKEVAEKEANERGGKYSCIVFAKHIPRNDIDEVYEAKCPEHYTQGTTTATELLRKYEEQPHPPVRWVRVLSEKDLPTEENNMWLTEWTTPDDPMVIHTDYCDKHDIAYHFKTPEIGGIRYLIEAYETPSLEQPKENDPELIRLREENFLLKTELETLKHPL